MFWNFIPPSPSRIRKRSTGFTLIEVMMVVLLLSLILGALYFIFSRGQKNAGEVFQNLILNENAQKIVDNLANDIREANVVEPKNPEMIGPTEIAALKTGAENHTSLTMKKAIFNFAGDSPQKCTFNKVQFLVEKTDPRPNAKIQTWSLDRIEVPLDAAGQEKAPERKRKTIVSGIEEIMFYRVKPDVKEIKGTGPGIIYFKIRMGRTDKDPQKGRFTNDVVSAVKIRGSVPE